MVVFVVLLRVCVMGMCFEGIFASHGLFCGIVLLKNESVGVVNMSVC